MHRVLSQKQKEHKKNIKTSQIKTLRAFLLKKKKICFNCIFNVISISLIHWSTQENALQKKTINFFLKYKNINIEGGIKKGKNFITVIKKEWLKFPYKNILITSF